MPPNTQNPPGPDPNAAQTQTSGANTAAPNTQNTGRDFFTEFKSLDINSKDEKINKRTQRIINALRYDISEVLISHKFRVNDTSGENLFENANSDKNKISNKEISKMKRAIEIVVENARGRTDDEAKIVRSKIEKLLKDQLDFIEAEEVNAIDAEVVNKPTQSEPANTANQSTPDHNEAVHNHKSETHAKKESFTWRSIKNTFWVMGHPIKATKRGVNNAIWGIENPKGVWEETKKNAGWVGDDIDRFLEFTSFFNIGSDNFWLWSGMKSKQHGHGNESKSKH
jgi:hypothetical protein